MCEFVKQNWPALGFAILPNLGTKIGFIVMRNADLKYCEKLKTPSWTPPYWVFPTVWTTMYTGIGYASYLVYKEGDGLQGAAKLPLAIYGAHVLANWAWNPIFFGLKNIKLSLVDMAVIDITALGMVCTFSRVNRVAGTLIIPYCLWLGFATFFNYCMYRDNKEEPKEK